MNGTTAIDFVRYEIGEYLEYGKKFKKLIDFYNGTKNVISFRLEHHIYNFEEADKALKYLDEFYKKQLNVEEEQEKVTEEFGHDEDDEER